MNGYIQNQVELSCKKWFSVTMTFFQDKQAVEDLANYIITVKCQYFIIMSMHSIYKRNYAKLLQVLENLNR